MAISVKLVAKAGATIEFGGDFENDEWWLRIENSAGTSSTAYLTRDEAIDLYSSILHSVKGL